MERRVSKGKVYDYGKLKKCSKRRPLMRRKQRWHRLTGNVNISRTATNNVKLQFQWRGESTPWSIKTCNFYFFEKLRETLTDFNNFWHARLEKLNANGCCFGYLTFNTVATLPCEMQKS